MNISNIDFFGVGINLKYLNNQKFQSNFGAFLSILIACMICIETVIVGSELIKKENPDVIFEERYVASPRKFTMKKDTFNFAFGVEYPKNYTHFIDESIYTIEVNQHISVKEYDKKTGQYVRIQKDIPLSVNPCKLSDFQMKDTAEYFKTLSGVLNMYCVDQDVNQPYMEGNFDQDVFSEISFYFRKCSNNKNCRSPQEITEILTNSFVAVYSDDIIVNPKKIEPFQTVGRDFYWNVSPQVSKNIDMYYRNVYIQSDKGIFFKEITEEIRTKHSYQSESIIFDEPSYFFNISMRFEKVKESFYYRTYKKLDHSLAEIGGIAKALMIIGFIVGLPVNQLLFYKQISNKLFSFKEESVQVTNENKSEKKQEKQLNENNQSKENQLSVSISQINQKEQNMLKSKSLLYRSQNLQQKFKTLTPVSPLKTHYFSPLNKQIQERNGIQQIQQNNNSIKNNDKEPKTGDYSNENIFKLKQLQVSMKNIQKAGNKLTAINRSFDSSESNFKIEQSCNPLYSERNDKILENVVPSPSFFKNEEKKASSKLSLNLKWFEYLKYYFWPFGDFQRKKKQIVYSVEKVFQHLDIINIVQKLLEFEKIKQLILNEDQIKLIQFFPKPTLDIDEIEKESQQKSKNPKNVSLLNDISKLTDIEKIKEAYQALKNILKKEELSHTDKKIIEMIDKSLLDQIEYNLHYLKEFEEFELEKQPEIHLTHLSEKQFAFPENQINNEKTLFEQQVPSISSLSVKSINLDREISDHRNSIDHKFKSKKISSIPIFQSKFLNESA